MPRIPIGAAVRLPWLATVGQPSASQAAHPSGGRRSWCSPPRTGARSERPCVAAAMQKPTMPIRPAHRRRRPVRPRAASMPSNVCSRARRGPASRYEGRSACRPVEQIRRGRPEPHAREPVGSVPQIVSRRTGERAVAGMGCESGVVGPPPTGGTRPRPPAQGARLRAQTGQAHRPARPGLRPARFRWPWRRSLVPRPVRAVGCGRSARSASRSIGRRAAHRRRPAPARRRPRRRAPSDPH